jgi:8-oxo-dGTP diphosphatase
MDNKRPKVGVGVYIYNKQGEVLLMKRKGTHGVGSWCPPGGHLEFNESWEKCAHRETKEEAGINIKNIKFIDVTNDTNFTEGVHYITIAMRADLKSGIAKIMEPDKSSGIGWFKPQKFPKPLFLPVKNLLKKCKL